MTKARTRRLALTAALLGATLGLSACGVGKDAATNRQYQPGVGANVRTGDVQLYNALLVDNGSSFTLSAGVLNATDRDQTLTSYSVTPLDGGAAIDGEPSSQVVATPENLLTLRGQIIFDSPDLVDGHYARITLTFRDAGEVTVEAPIVPRTAEYDDVASTPGAPSSDATPTPSGSAPAPETTPTP